MKSSIINTLLYNKPSLKVIVVGSHTYNNFKRKKKKRKKEKKKKKKPILWNLHAIFYIFFSHVYKNSFWYLSLSYIIMEHLNVEFLHLNYIVNCIIHHCRSREISSKSNFKHEKRKVYRRASWVYSRLERVFA